MMLCSDCKKNVAVIYINKVEDNGPDGKKNEMIGLCAECAKKRGIKTFDPSINPFENVSPEEMAGLSKQFEKLFSNIDMDKLSNMFNGFGPDGMPGMDPSMFGSEETLVLNANNKLVQYVLVNKDAEHTNLFCEQLYDLAMISHKPLSPEAMTKFIARSNQIMMLLAK